MEGIKNDEDESLNINSYNYMKSFIIFRKDLNDKNLNTTQCFAESKNKKVSFDLKDDKNFLSKSNIDKNLKAIKNHFNLRYESAKDRKNNFNKISPLLLNENKNIKMHLNLDENVKTNFIFSKQKLDNKKRKYNDEDFNYKINEKSDKKSVEYRVSKVVQDINEKESQLIDLKKNNSEISSKNISHEKNIQIPFNNNQTEDFKKNNKENYDSNINLDSIPLKKNIYNGDENLNNCDSKNIKGSFTSIIDYADENNDIKDFNFQPFNLNNKPILGNSILEIKNRLEVDKKRRKEEEKNFSNHESEKYIYESIDELKNRIEYGKNKSESINIIYDQFMQNEDNKYLSKISSQENLKSNEDNDDDKILYQISGQYDDIKINDLINLKGNLNKTLNKSNKKISKNVNGKKLSNLFKINDSKGNKNKKDYLFLENKHLINRTISIKNEQLDDDFKLEKISSQILRRNNKSTPKKNPKLLNENSKDIDFNEGSNIEFKNEKLQNRKSVQNQEKLDSQCNVTVEESSIIYPLQFCYICDNLNQIDFVYKTETCKHSICFKCLKLFYEAKFDQNRFSLKCPIFTCDGKFQENLFKNIISEYYFNLLINNKSNLLINRTDLINNKNKPQIYQKDIISNEDVIIYNENRASNIYKIESKKNQNSSNLNNNKYHQLSKYYNINENETATNINSNMKSYTKKNIVEINNLDNFLIYNQNKDNYCKKCNQPSLFNRPDKSTSKCLNCFSISCKYCLKQISYDHFDLNSFNYCKVYFRRKLKNLTIKNNNINKCKNLIISFLMIIASYILFFFNCFFSLSKFLREFINLDKFKNQINFFYFINNLNYRKYEYINNFIVEKKKNFYENYEFQRENVIDINNTKHNKRSKNLDENLLIHICKKNKLNNQEYNNNFEFNEDNRIKYNEYQKTMQIEDHINYNKSVIDELKLLDKNLINFIKTNLENGNSLNRFRIRKILKLPDNRGEFYFEECKKNSNIEAEMKNQFYFENLIKNLKSLKYFSLKDDLLIFKVFKYLIFYIFFIGFGLILFVILILIIPYFPLLIIIFQF